MEEKKRISLEEAEAWYTQNHDIYRGFGTQIRDLLETLLDGKGLVYQSISHRTKAKDSFLKKYKDKEYDAPWDITDVAGLRIIAYTSSDVERICSLIRQEFAIDEENSVNKAEKLESNEVGYLSVHFIASPNEKRSELPEYSRYRDLKCEIQVRTLLQHAWAEIEHDRNYKFGGELPKDIKRRFYLVAGTLELMDQEFQSISDDIDSYAKQVAKRVAKQATKDTKEGQLDIPIDSVSVAAFMRQKFPDLGEVNNMQIIESEVIQELHDMGVQTLADLEKMIPPSLVEKINKKYKGRNYIGVIRTIMIIHDAERYFETAWNDHWQATSSESAAFWRENGVDLNCIKGKIKIWN